MVRGGNLDKAARQLCRRPRRSIVCGLAAQPDCAALLPPGNRLGAVRHRRGIVVGTVEFGTGQIAPELVFRRQCHGCSCCSGKTANKPQTAKAPELPVDDLNQILHAMRWPLCVAPITPCMPALSPTLKITGAHACHAVSASAPGGRAPPATITLSSWSSTSFPSARSCALAPSKPSRSQAKRTSTPCCASAGGMMIRSTMLTSSPKVGSLSMSVILRPSVAKCHAASAPSLPAPTTSTRCPRRSGCESADSTSSTGKVEEGNGATSQHEPRARIRASARTSTGAGSRPRRNSTPARASASS